jgi:hypothetical protein
MPATHILCGIAVCSLWVTGCASVPMASPESDAAAKTFKTDSSKANIYVYRDENYGAAIKMPVLIDNVSVGDTAAMTYIYRQVDPGTHVITSKTENDATLSLEAKAGFNYFVWQEVKIGMFAARSKLHLVDETTGRSAVADCKLVQ